METKLNQEMKDELEEFIANMKEYSDTEDALNGHIRISRGNGGKCCICQNNHRKKRTEICTTSYCHTCKQYVHVKCFAKHAAE